GADGPAPAARKRKWPAPHEARAGGGVGGVAAPPGEPHGVVEDVSGEQAEHVLASCSADGSVRFWRLAVRGGDGAAAAAAAAAAATPRPAAPGGTGSVGCIGELSLAHPTGGRYGRLAVRPRLLPADGDDGGGGGGDDDEADGEVVVALADAAPGGGIRLVWARLPPGGDEGDGGDDSKVEGEGEASLTSERLLRGEGGVAGDGAPPYTALAWVHGGRALAAGDAAGNVVVWDVGTGRVSCAVAPFADWPGGRDDASATATTGGADGGGADSGANDSGANDRSVLSLAVLAGGHALLATDATGRRLSLLTVSADGTALTRVQTLEFGADTSLLGAAVKDTAVGGSGGGSGDGGGGGGGGGIPDDSDEDDSSSDDDDDASEASLHWCPFAAEASGEFAVGWNVRSRCLYLLHYSPATRRIDGLAEAGLRAPVLSAAPTLAARHVALTDDGGVPRAGSVREVAVWAVTPAAVQLLHLPVDDLMPPPEVVAAAAVVAKASGASGDEGGDGSADGGGGGGGGVAAAASVDGEAPADGEALDGDSPMAGVEPKKPRVGRVPLSPVLAADDAKFSAGSTAGGTPVAEGAAASGGGGGGGSGGGGGGGGPHVTSPRLHKAGHAAGVAAAAAVHRGVRSPRALAAEAPVVEPQHILFNQVTAVPPVVLPPSTHTSRPPPPPPPPAAAAAAAAPTGGRPVPRPLPTSPRTLSTLLPRVRPAGPSVASGNRPTAAAPPGTAEPLPPPPRRVTTDTSSPATVSTSRTQAPASEPPTPTSGAGAPRLPPAPPAPEVVAAAVRDAAARGAADAASAFAAAAAARDAEDEARLATLLASVGTTMDGAIGTAVTSAIHAQMASVVVPALAALLRPAAAVARAPPPPPPPPPQPPVDVDALAAAVASALTVSAAAAASLASSASGGAGGGDAWLAREYEAAMGAARLADAASAAADVMSRQIAASVRAGVQAAAAASVDAPLRDVCEATAEAEAALVAAAATVSAAAAAAGGAPPAGGLVGVSPAAAAATAAAEAEAAAAAAAASEAAAEAARLERRALVERAAAEDDVEAAFVAALDGGDWPLLRWLLSSLNAQWACESGRLSQVALVSLLQQLGVGLGVPPDAGAAGGSTPEAAAEAASDTRLRVLWLNEALQAADTAAPEARAYLPGILDLLLGRLEALLASGGVGGGKAANAQLVKKVRVCLLFVKSLRAEV
ncbi:hypothetical protein BU14_1575s0001, partial [Porphyra umbilicalis]